MFSIKSSSRWFLLGILCLSVGWGVFPFRHLPLASGALKKPEHPYLEEWTNAGQAEGGVFRPTKAPHSLSLESTTIGRLIASRTDPLVWPEEKITELSHFILKKSRQYSVSPFLVLSLIEVESGFRADAVSPKGAMGLMQLMPTTAEHVALSAGLQWLGPSVLEDPKTNIELALRYVAYLKTQFQKPEHVLTAYNMGPAALEKRLKKGQKVSLEYYQRVMNAMRSYAHQAKSSDFPARRRTRTWL